MLLLNDANKEFCINSFLNLNTIFFGTNFRLLLLILFAQIKKEYLKKKKKKEKEKRKKEIQN